MLAFLFIFFVGSVLLQIAFYGGVVPSFWRNAQAVLVENKNVYLPFVSVIVAARNEKQHLPELVKALATQEYKGEFEIVVVNDRSTDGSGETLDTLCNQYPTLRVHHIKEKPLNWDGKKYALQQASKKARGEILLFTDADCRPVSKYWIREIIGCFSSKTDLVLGVGRYDFAKNRWLNHFIQYETLLTALQYLGFAAWGKPYMGVGRNIAYRKKAFLKTGYGNYQHCIGGDDDLMVNRLANSQNVSICWQPIAHTITSPPETWRSWFFQKKRHLRASKRYTLKNKLRIGSLVISQLTVWGSFSVLLGNSFYFYPVIILFLLRMLALQIVLKTAALKLNSPSCKNHFCLSIIDLAYTVYLLGVGVVSWFSKQQKWR